MAYYALTEGQYEKILECLKGIEKQKRHLLNWVRGWGPGGKGRGKNKKVPVASAWARDSSSPPRQKKYKTNYYIVPFRTEAFNCSVLPDIS